MKLLLVSLLMLSSLCECKRVSSLSDELEKDLKKTFDLLNDIKRELNEEEECKDTGPETLCQQIKDRGHCDRKFPQQKCEKTCGVCDGEISAECRDTFPRCQKIKDRGHCDRKFPQQNCGKTCGVCDGSKTTDAPETKVITPEPEVEIPEPEIEIPEPEIEIPGPEVETPKPEVETPEPEIETPEPEVETAAPDTGKTSAPSIYSVTEPTECNDGNKGHCECADTSKGFQTYTFQVEGVTRCFTVYHPKDRVSETLPVVLSSQCYAKDKIMGIGMTSDRTDANQAASRYGFVRIGLSTPDGHWTFGNDNVVNDDKPMPCSENDSKDIPYIKAVFNFIESHPNQFDSSKIYAEGFSQNSMFSAYIGFCFSEKVVGVWQGGSGMSLTGQKPNLPGCQGQCKASVYAEIGNCRQCMSQQPCSECQYWPIYPCYNRKRPMIDCLAEYSNDGIAVDKDGDPDVSSTSRYMFDKLNDEGHDGRLLRFSPSDDGTIKGGHQNPKNTAYWQVGCLGITESCTTECEAEFLTCIEDQDSSTASKQVEAFEHCMEEPDFSSMNGCTAACAPTLEMLKASEEPTILKLSKNIFGAGESENSRPGSSRCET